MSWESLQARHPWPATRPDLPDDWHGWHVAGTIACLSAHLGPDTRLVVECGSWLGLSARAILAEYAPYSRLVCIDTWKGSREHQPESGNLEWAKRLPTLFEQFLANMWPWRGRLIPLLSDSIDGMAEVAAADLVPDLVYLDSEHSHDRVTRELTICREQWPQAIIVLDDTDNPAVGDPVRQFVNARDLRTEWTVCATAIFPEGS